MNKYVGIPFQYQGTGSPGYDCWTFVKMFYSRELGIELLGVDDYSRNWAGEGKNYMLENYHKQWDQVPCPMPNDLLLFNNSAGVTCHCGIYLGENKFIHCAKIAGVIISRIGEWKQPLQGVYRFKT